MFVSWRAQDRTNLEVPGRSHRRGKANPVRGYPREAASQTGVQRWGMVTVPGSLAHANSDE